MSTTWNPLKMTYKQFKKANSFILSALTILLLAVGCVSEKEVIYKRIYFADTNGVITIYYPQSMEKDIKTPHDDKRWTYVASKDAPDKGTAKEMVLSPHTLEKEITDEDMKQYSEEYHRLHPECTYHYHR